MKYFRFLFCFLSLLIHVSCDDDESSQENTYAGCCEGAPLELNFDPGKIFIPNIFTPNSDGINDILLVFADTGVVEILSFVIRDKSDRIVFENDRFQPNSGIDGWIPEGGALEGNYTFSVEIESIDGRIHEGMGEVCLFYCDSGNQFDPNGICGYGTQHNGVGGFNIFSISGEDCN